MKLIGYCLWYLAVAGWSFIAWVVIINLLRGVNFPGWWNAVGGWLADRGFDRGSALIIGFVLVIAILDFIAICYA